MLQPCHFTYLLTLTKKTMKGRGRLKVFDYLNHRDTIVSSSSNLRIHYLIVINTVQRTLLKLNIFKENYVTSNFYHNDQFCSLFQFH